MSISWHMDLGSLADWMTFIATLGAVVVASSGVEAWRKQTRSTARHKVALEVAELVGNLHVEFFNQRARLIEPFEFPEGYYDQRDRSNHQEAEAHRHVFTERYRKLYPSILAIHNARGRAMAVLGRECADSLVSLTQKAREIQSVWGNFCTLLEGGREANVPGRADLDLYESQALVNPFGRNTDALSVEFEACYYAALAALSKHIELSE